MILIVCIIHINIFFKYLAKIKSVRHLFFEGEIYYVLDAIAIPPAIWPIPTHDRTFPFNFY